MRADRNVLLLGLTSFINDVSSELISAVLPLFISQLGGEGVALGMVSGLRELLSNGLKPFSGYLSDRFRKKKPLIVSGYLVSAIFKLLIGFSKNVNQVVLSSTLERVGKGLRTAPRDALISLSKGKSGKKFGIHRSMDTAGALVGVILATLLIYLGFSNRTVILTGGVISFFSLVPLIPVKEVETASPKKENLSERKEPLNREFFKILLVLTLYSAGALSFMFLIFVAGKETSEETALLLYLLLNIAYLSTSLPAGNLSDRAGKTRVLSAGYAISAISLLFLAVHKNLLLLTISFLLYGIAMGITDTVQRALIGEITGKTKRGTAYGLFHGITGVGALAGNLSAGYLWNLWGNASFLLFSLFCFLSSALMGKLIRS